MSGVDKISHPIQWMVINPLSCNVPGGVQGSIPSQHHVQAWFIAGYLKVSFHRKYKQQNQ